MKFYDKQAILNRLTKDDVIKICIALGSDGYRKGNGGELIFQTVCHGSDSWKLYYYHEPHKEYPGRMFHCYTKCGDSFSIFELVIRANRAKGKNITWYKAVSFVAEMTGNLIYSSSMKPQKKVIDDFSWINNFRKEGKVATECEEVNEHVLEMFCYIPHEVFLNDHISPEVMSEFEISYWGLTNQIVLPHRDKDQRLIGVRGRYLDEEDVERIGKYVPLYVEGKFLRHELGNNLYGIHINQRRIMESKKILLVEGEKSLLQSHSYLGDKDFSCATCGSNITSRQIDLMLHYLDVEELILGYDKEFHAPESWEANIYRNKLLKKIAPIIPYIKVSVLWDKNGLLGYKDSPTDKGKDVLEQMLDERIELDLDDMKMLDDELIDTEG